MALFVESKTNDDVELELEISSGNNGNINSITEIKLKYEDHRGNYFNLDETHPIKLLNKTKKLYCSSKCSSFNQNENDWIIFKFANNKKIQFTPIPTKMMIKNGSCKSGVKKMRLYIGNKNNDEWYQLIDGDIILEKQEDECQSFDITDTIKFDDLKHIKLEFIDNYGEKWEMGAKFCLFEFQLYGYIA